MSAPCVPQLSVLFLGICILKSMENGMVLAHLGAQLAHCILCRVQTRQNAQRRAKAWIATVLLKELFDAVDGMRLLANLRGKLHDLGIECADTLAKNNFGTINDHLVRFPALIRVLCKTRWCLKANLVGRRERREGLRLHPRRHFGCTVSLRGEVAQLRLLIGQRCVCAADDARQSLYGVAGRIQARVLRILETLKNTGNVGLEALLPLCIGCCQRENVLIVAVALHDQRLLLNDGCLLGVFAAGHIRGSCCQEGSHGCFVGLSGLVDFLLPLFAAIIEKRAIVVELLEQDALEVARRQKRLGCVVCDGARKLLVRYCLGRRRLERVGPCLVELCLGEWIKCSKLLLGIGGEIGQLLGKAGVERRALADKLGHLLGQLCRKVAVGSNARHCLALCRLCKGPSEGASVVHCDRWFVHKRLFCLSASPLSCCSSSETRQQWLQLLPSSTSSVLTADRPR
eukprot:m.126418 g.126418  ORF g.126418 m.126418 type:complete len:457 (+) comp9707_c0_seq1:3193-4563(+)